MRIPALCLLAFALFSCLGCQQQEETSAVWFVHATDPHLFEEPPGKTSDGKPADPDKYDRARQLQWRQEDLNQRAFTALLSKMGELPDDQRPAFLVVTGDFGIGEDLGDLKAGTCGDRTLLRPANPGDSNPSGVDQKVDLTLVKDSDERRAQCLADLLGASPNVHDVYWVPGNNDIEREAATEDALAKADAILANVAKKLGGRIKLHNLTGCYTNDSADLSRCWTDIPGTSFRLVGFPSYSFKNNDPKSETAQATSPPAATRAQVSGPPSGQPVASTTPPAEAGKVKPPATPSQASKPLDEKSRLQEKQVERFAELVQQADAAGKKVLVLSHIPELDDPFTEAQDKFDGNQRYNPAQKTRPEWSAWNVSEPVFKKWKSLVDGSAVVGVLAGHFHDSHRELYEPPYRWARTSLDRADFSKSFVAPPLAVRLQDSSPIQARGFSLVRLTGDHMTRSIFWFDQDSSTFAPEPEKKQPAGRYAAPLAMGWLWNIGADKENLARAALVAIALVAALLTVIATWEIAPATMPPASTAPLPSASSVQKPAGGSTSGSPTSGKTNPFQGNFARTVLGGLGGMAAVSFVDDSYWKDAGVSPKAHYLVLFVIFFLAILVTSAVYQGSVEALRSRVILRQQSPPWNPRRKGESKASQHLLYWGRRSWRWWLSMRSAVLIFLDTVFNVIQGKNQTRTALFGEEVRKLHWSLVWAADRLRENLDRKILATLNTEATKKLLTDCGISPPKDEDVRVNISVLSADRSSAFYVSWERGSLPRPFDQHSVAWISMYVGEARWSKDGARPDGEGGSWRAVYADSKESVLFDNSHGDLPGEPSKILLGTHYQDRTSSDYEAFIILPVPWSRRGEYLDYQRAGIQISFRKAAYMDVLWEGLEKKEMRNQESVEAPNYPAWRGLLRTDKEESLRLKHPELQIALFQAVDVLGELFRYFNPTVFEEHIRPQLKS